MVHVSSSCNPCFHATGAHYINADTTAFMQFLLSDLFKDFPTLKFIIPHGGGAAPYHWGRYRGIAQDLKRPPFSELLLKNVFFDTCVYHRPGIELLLKVVPADNILFASEMVGAVRGIDPDTGHHYDDTRRYLEPIEWLSAADRAQDLRGQRAPRVLPLRRAHRAGREHFRSRRLTDTTRIASAMAPEAQLRPLHAASAPRHAPAAAGTRLRSRGRGSRLLARLGAFVDCRVHETGPDSSLGGDGRARARGGAGDLRARGALDGRTHRARDRRAGRRSAWNASRCSTPGGARGRRAAPGDEERAARLALLDDSRAKKACARWAASGSSGWCIRRASRIDALIDAILDMIERQTPDHFAAQIEALLARPDAGAVLRGIRCPTLVLCGRQDAWSPLAQHEEMAAMIPGADARRDRRLRSHGADGAARATWPTRCCDWLRVAGGRTHEGERRWAS